LLFIVVFSLGCSSLIPGTSDSISAELDELSARALIDDTFANPEATPYELLNAVSLAQFFGFDDAQELLDEALELATGFRLENPYHQIHIYRLLGRLGMQQDLEPAQIQHYFDKNEADVFKKGNQLVIRLKDMHFPAGQAIIMPENYLLLSKVQRAIRSFGEPMLLIEGHTDCTDTPELNKHLSKQRADAVREYLINAQTLPADKIIALGFGPERPLASNETEAGRAQNRRIDLILSPSK